MSDFIDYLAVRLAEDPEMAFKTVVFPNKRAGLFLKHRLQQIISKDFIFPEILSVSSFFSRVTGWQKAEYYDLLFTLLEAYRESMNQAGLHPQTAEKFLGWGPVLLNDFDEIDKFNVNPGQIFTSLHDIKELEEWAENIDATKKDLKSEYLKFFKSLPQIYRTFKRKLIEKSWAYEGMIYRQAMKTYDVWSKNFGKQQLIFAGFNALSETERIIIRQLVQEKKADVYWDIDRFYVNKPFEAGKYFRKYTRDPVLGPTVQPLFDRVKPPKEVIVVKTLHDTEQLHFVSHLIKQWQKEYKDDNDFWLKTAVVVNDPALGLPLIHSLPPQPEALNITFGLPLSHFNETRRMLNLFRIKTLIERNGYIDWEQIKNLISDELFQLTIPGHALEKLENTIQASHRKRFFIKTFLTYLEQAGITHLQQTLSAQKPHEFLENINRILETSISNIREKTRQPVIIELQTLIRKSMEIQHRYSIFQNFDMLEGFFQKLVKEVRLFFEGEPLKGLQIMGLLETRALSFDRIIMTGMNEGIIPKGKTQDSFIPYDVRKHNNLPVWEDKNAIYAYHVYRLFGHSKTSYWLFNGNPSGLFSGEKSRFLTQLEQKLPGHNIQPQEITIESHTQSIPEPDSIPKNKTLSEILRKRLQNRGLSASALKNYLYRPYDFYTGFVLDLESLEEPEESLSARWSGLIVHDVMETLYRPYIGKPLTVSNLEKILTQVPQTIQNVFFDKYLKTNQKSLNNPDISGKDLLALSAAENMIKKYIRHDKKLVEQGKNLIIQSLEKEYKTEFTTAYGEKILLKGFIDRIDLYENHIRIIDYKTGKAEGLTYRNNLKESLRKEEKSYLLQLLFYALLLKNHLSSAHNPIIYIYSSRANPVQISKEITNEEIVEFETFLSEIIEEMLNPDISFGKPFPQEKKYFP